MNPFVVDINNDVQSTSVVDKETGELLPAKLIVNPENYRVVPEQTIKSRKEYFNRKNRKDVFDELAERFTFTYISKVSELYVDKRFTEDEKTRIMFLGTFVTYSDKGNYLAFSNGIHITKRHLRDVLGIKEKKKFYSFYNKLIDADIIEEVATNCDISLKWSEEYHFRGKLPKRKRNKDAGLLKTYDKQIQELYLAKKNNGKSVHSPKQLYTVFMLLPFVHYETNVLCKYPEKNFAECEPLEIEELATGLGFSRSNDLKRKMLKIVLKEQPVFSFNITAKATHVTVNPFVVWRQNRMPDNSLLVTFFDTAKRIAEEKGMHISLDDLLKIHE